MELPNKRQKTSSPDFHSRAGRTYNETRELASRPQDYRNATDRPRKKYLLPGYEPWVLVKTKLRRRFVHNTDTKESLWRIPQEVFPGVLAFEKWERTEKEKRRSARGVGSAPATTRDDAREDGIDRVTATDETSRRRRSESLQREDEEAMMAELAAQADDVGHRGERQSSNVPSYEPKIGYDSEGSYEEIEVTDSEFELEDDQNSPPMAADDEDQAGDGEDQNDAPVEFGEDDIAYQLAAMGEDYGLDPGEYGDPDEQWQEGDEGLPLSEEDAVNLFRDLLDDYGVSPFKPWETVIADESEASILNDERYTVLPNMRARKEVWDRWARDKAAQIKQARRAMEQKDPKIPYLAFLQEKATPKLYWPEFKRKYRRDAELNDRKLSDKEREKLYRDHINRLKLSESVRKADLLTLLKGVPLKLLNRNTTLDSLPQQVLAHLHYVSLAPATRDRLIQSYLRDLPLAPEADDMSEEQRLEDAKRREERRRREQALADRERKVEDERRQNEKDEARAKRDLREEERELQQAMAVGNRGLQSQIHGAREDIAMADRVS